MRHPGSDVRRILALAALLVAVRAAAADPAAVCSSAKRKAAAKKIAAKLACVSKAANAGVAVDPPCLLKAESKFTAAFAKAEAKGGCLTTGDAAAIEVDADACVGTFRAALGVAGTPPKSHCTAAKLKATGTKVAGKTNCWARAALKFQPVSATCLSGAETKFSLAFGKAELKGDCVTTNDAASVEAYVDACVTTLVSAIAAPTTTTTTTTTSTTTTTAAPTCDTEPAAFSGIVAQHNATRATATPTPSPTLPAMCWSNTPATHAQAWADGCTYAHDPALGTFGEGQNIYAVALSVGFSTTAAQDAEPAWAAEAADYDYANNSCSSVCGHYTQVVWRTSTFVGCGIKNCTANSPFGAGFPNWTLVVCNYKPPGNFVGQRPY